MKVIFVLSFMFAIRQAFDIPPEWYEQMGKEYTEALKAEAHEEKIRNQRQENANFRKQSEEELSNPFYQDMQMYPEFYFDNVDDRYDIIPEELVDDCST